MASTAWIESAAHQRKPAIGQGMEGNYQHVLAMARADEQCEAHERVLAARAVQRLGSEHAGELLDMLGLAIPAPPPVPVEPAGPVPTKRCTQCGERKPHTAFTRSAKTPDGLYCQCRECRNATRRALYIQRGYRGMTKGDGNINWRHAAPGGYGVSSSAEAVERRITMWADLRVEQKREPRKAAERMEISMRTARRYDRTLKDRGLLPETDGSGRVVGDQVGPHLASRPGAAEPLSQVFDDDAEAAPEQEVA